jgi:3',5'-cyclic AMP phosphodiesterase CpdA
MRTIVHLSDLHFGRVDEGTTEPLIRQIKELHPHLVAISGDLTQRARTRQFQAARRFLASLPQPQIVVPGNHDVPAYNLIRRFLEPLRKYRLNVTGELLPSYVDDEIAVFGLNSTLSLTTKHGRLRERDIARVCEKLRQLPGDIAKIVVCHHPFDLPPKHTQRDLIRSATSAMSAFAECRVDVILTGHLHLSHTSQTAERYPIPGYSALMVQAGTATSNRCRGELNSFNVLRIQAASVVVETLNWDQKASSYTLLRTEEFKRVSDGWVPANSSDSSFST